MNGGQGDDGQYSTLEASKQNLTPYYIDTYVNAQLPSGGSYFSPLVCRGIAPKLVLSASLNKLWVFHDPRAPQAQEGEVGTSEALFSPVPRMGTQDCIGNVDHVYQQSLCVTCECIGALAMPQ